MYYPQGKGGAIRRWDSEKGLLRGSWPVFSVLQHVEQVGRG